MFEETTYNIAIITDNQEFAEMLSQYHQFDHDEIFQRRESKAEEFLNREEFSLEELPEYPLHTPESKTHNLTIEVLQGTQLYPILHPKRYTFLSTP